ACSSSSLGRLELECGRLADVEEPAPPVPLAEEQEPQQTGEGDADRDALETPDEAGEHSRSDDEDQAQPDVEATARLPSPHMGDGLWSDRGGVVAAPAAALDDVAEVDRMGFPALAADGDRDRHGLRPL